MPQLKLHIIRFLLPLLAFPAGILLQSCGNGNGGEEVDKITEGHITMIADEAVYPVIEEIVDVFEMQYPKAEIDLQSGSEAAAMHALLNDSARAIVISRQLNDEERNLFEKWIITPKEAFIALDAVALLVNDALGVDSLDSAAYAGILSGKIANWEAVSENASGPVTVVYDNKQSGVFRYVRERFIPSDSLPRNAFAAKNTEEVYKYVQEHPNAVGLVGMNQFLQKENSGDSLGLHPLKLQPPDSARAPSGSFALPYQSQMAAGEYPLTRKIWFIAKEHYYGLGTGFASFAAGDVGQRIILKSGLYPAIPPGRIVKFPEKQDE